MEKKYLQTCGSFHVEAIKVKNIQEKILFSQLWFQMKNLTSFSITFARKRGKFVGNFCFYDFCHQDLRFHSWFEREKKV
jgi:hypothetical protein